MWYNWTVVPGSVSLALRLCAKQIYIKRTTKLKCTVAFNVCARAHVVWHPFFLISCDTYTYAFLSFCASKKKLKQNQNWIETTTEHKKLSCCKKIWLTKKWVILTVLCHVVALLRECVWVYVCAIQIGITVVGFQHKKKRRNNNWKTSDQENKISEEREKKSSPCSDSLHRSTRLACWACMLVCAHQSVKCGYMKTSNFERVGHRHRCHRTTTATAWLPKANCDELQTRWMESQFHMSGF